MTQEMGETPSLLARLDRAERRITFLKRTAIVLASGFAGLAVAVSVVAWHVSTPRPSKSLEAEEFILRDSAHKLRAALRVGEDGPYLGFFDGQKEDEPARMYLNTSGFLISDAEGQREIELGTNGRLRQLMLGRDSTRHAALVVDENDSWLGLADANQSNPFTKLSSGREESRLDLTDPKGNLRVQMSARKEEEVLIFADDNLTQRVTLKAQAGTSDLSLKDVNGKTGAWLHVVPDGPGLYLYDANGNLMRRNIW